MHGLRVNLSSICLSICVFIYLFICLSIHSFIILHIYPSIYLSISQNGKLREMCEDIWHVPTRDNQCRSVRRVSLVVFWTNQKTLWRNISTSTKVCVPLGHSRISIHLLTEQNMMYLGWFWIFLANSGHFCGRGCKNGQFRQYLWSGSHFAM